MLNITLTIDYLSFRINVFQRDFVIFFIRNSRLLSTTLLLYYCGDFLEAEFQRRMSIPRWFRFSIMNITAAAIFSRYHIFSAVFRERTSLILLSLGHQRSSNTWFASWQATQTGSKFLDYCTTTNRIQFPRITLHCISPVSLFYIPGVVRQISCSIPANSEMIITGYIQTS